MRQLRFRRGRAKRDDIAAWERSSTEPALWLDCPSNAESASVGNGMMIASRIADRKAVDTLHAKYVELDVTDEAPRPARRPWSPRKLFPGSGWQQIERLCSGVTLSEELALTLPVQLTESDEHIERSGSEI